MEWRSGDSFGEAFGKAQLAVGSPIPASGRAFISVKTSDQSEVISVARYFCENGFELVATEGTAKALSAAGIKVETVNKVTEGRPHIVDMIKNDEIDLIVNTTAGKESLADSYTIRRQALNRKVTYFTTLSGAKAACEAHGPSELIRVNRLQDLHGELVQ